MDSRAPSAPRPRFGCDGSWLMASLAKVSSTSFRFCLLKPSSTRRRTVSLFWSVVMVDPLSFVTETGRGSQGPGGHLAGTGARTVRLVPRERPRQRASGRACATPVDGAVCNDLALLARHWRTPSFAHRNAGSQGACGAPRRHWGSDGASGPEERPRCTPDCQEHKGLFRAFVPLADPLQTNRSSSAHPCAQELD